MEKVSSVEGTPAVVRPWRPQTAGRAAPLAVLPWGGGVLLALLLSGCPSRSLDEQRAQPAPTTQQVSASPAPAARLWVGKQLSGGEQCAAEPATRDSAEPPTRPGRPGEAAPPAQQPAASPGPPSLAELSDEQLFQVHDARREPLAVCSACGCPAWAFSYELLIDHQALPAARRAGFKPLQEAAAAP